MVYLSIDGKYVSDSPLVKYDENEDRYIQTEPGKWFECDELMIPVIQLLLQKGYRTENCCSSHWFTHVSNPNLDEPYMRPLTDLGYINHDQAYISFAVDVRDIPIPPPKEDGWNLYYDYITTNEKDGEIYLDYGDHDEPPEDPDCLYNVVIRNDLYQLDTIAMYSSYDYYFNLIIILKRLYKWAQSLPDRKDEMK